MKNLVLVKGVSKIIKNDAKEQKSRLIGMLLGILGAGLLVYLLTGKKQLKLVKAQLEQSRIFNAVFSFN